MPARFILSTVGIGLFLNALKPEELPKWRFRINSVSNAAELEDEMAVKIASLRQRALELLQNGAIADRRRLSPELNGLYALCGNSLDTNQDMHYLIATDTTMGRAAAEIICEFLRKQGVANVNYHIPPRLNTASLSTFSEGIKNLLTWCENTIPSYHDSNYEVVFNLTAAFKSLQGYLNIVGMFYADRLVYIFEGSSELLSIPRLPVRVDAEQLEAVADKLAMLAAGDVFQRRQIADVPGTLLDVDEKGDSVISDWGMLIWNRMKNEILGKRLLDFPHMSYAPSFLADFKKADRHLRISMQETLAKASVLLKEADGNTSILKRHGGLQYDNYTGKHTKDNRPIGHFRINDGDRISCISDGGKLNLRHFGAHDTVNDKP